MKGIGFGDDTNLLLERKVMAPTAGRIIETLRENGYKLIFHTYTPIDLPEFHDRLKEMLKTTYELFEECNILDSDLFPDTNHRTQPLLGGHLTDIKRIEKQIGTEFTADQLTGQHLARYGFGVAEARNSQFNFKTNLHRKAFTYNLPLVYLRNTGWEGPKHTQTYWVQVIKHSDNTLLETHAPEKLVKKLREVKKRIVKEEKRLVELLG